MGCNKCKHDNNRCNCSVDKEKIFSRYVSFDDVPELSCIDPENKIENLRDFALLVESKICENSGDYSQYEINCLRDKYGTIYTEARFVDIITSEVCSLISRVDSLSQAVADIDLSDIEEQLSSLINPNLNLIPIGVIGSDDLKTIIKKISKAIGDIQEFSDITNIDWGLLGGVAGTVDNLEQAFTLLINKIKNSGGGGIPTIDTTGTCLPNPSTQEPIDSALEKVIRVACESLRAKLEDLKLGCVQVNGDKFQDYLQAIFTTLDGLINSQYTFDDKWFSVTPTGEPCGGFEVSLKEEEIRDLSTRVSVKQGSSPEYLEDAIESTETIEVTEVSGKLEFNSLVKDEKVKALSNSSKNGYLNEVLEAGDRVNIYESPDGNKLIIEVEEDPATNEYTGKVLINSEDTEPGFLQAKILAGDNITITEDAFKRLVINSNPQSNTGTVKVNQSGALKFLEDSFTQGNNVSITTENDKLKIEVNNDKVKVRQNSSSSKYLDESIVTQNTIDSKGISVSKTVNSQGNVELSIGTNPTKIADDVVTQIEDNTTLSDRLCSVLGDCSGGGGADYKGRTVYVDASNTENGEGSPLNPFRSLETAIHYIIGSGTNETPEFPDVKSVEVLTGTYQVSRNLFVNGLAYNFRAGVNIVNTSSGFIFEIPSSINHVKKIEVRGYPNITSNNSGVFKIGNHELMESIHIELGDIYTYNELVIYENSYYRYDNTSHNYYLRGRVESLTPYAFNVSGVCDINIIGLTREDFVGGISVNTEGTAEVKTVKVKGLKFIETPLLQGNSLIVSKGQSELIFENNEVRNLKIEVVEVDETPSVIIANNKILESTIILKGVGQTDTLYTSYGNMVPTGAEFTGSVEVSTYEIK